MPASAILRAVYNTGTGTMGQEHWDACVGTWGLGNEWRGTRGLGDVWDTGTCGAGTPAREDVKYRGRGR